MVTTTADRFTRSDYLQLPEGFPAELIDGRLVKEPSPTYGHQRLILRILRQLLDIVGEGRVVMSPIDVSIDEHNIFQPDLLVVEEPLPGDAKEVGTPILVVEVLSPSTAARDRVEKRGIYLDAGVEEVWIVDPETQTVEIHTAEGARGFAGSEIAPSGTVPGFSLAPRVLFGA